VLLTETSSILEILFQYMYPQPQPDIDAMQFEDFALLAEAVEKYEVFSAMSICKMHMRMR
jgi:hypothetical protein